MSKHMYSLTNPQKSIWQTGEFYKGTSIENIAGRATILEKVDFKKFEQAINLFIEKNDSFRLKFVIDNNEIKQYVEEYTEFSFEKISVSSEKDVKKIEDEFASYVFDPLNSYLFKFVLYEFADGHGGFVIVMHHLISDAWTSGLVISEIINYYDALKNGEEIPIDKAPSYLEYAESEKEYENSDKFIKDKEFWNALYGTIPEVATVPSLNSNSNSSKAKRKQFILDKNLMDVIHEFCKAHKVSEFNFFMGVLSIYLGRVSNLDEFVIGTPILNRSNFKEKHTAGMFISVVPFKVSLGNCSFIDFISNISKDFMSIFRHQKYSYQTLIEDLRKKHGSKVPNLYNVMFSYQNMRSNKQTAKTNYDSKWLFCNNISDDLEVHMYDINDTGNIIMAYDYKCDKYKIEDIYSIHEIILNIINQILENETINVNNIEIVTEIEKHQILNKFNNTNVFYPKHKTISQLFEEQVLKTPDNIAVVFGDESLTYKELNKKANSLATYLRDNNISRNDIVGIMVNRSLEIIVSILAVLKAGACYIPIDPEYPQDRIEYMLENSHAKLLLTFKKLQNKVDFKNKVYVELDSNLYRTNKRNIENINQPEDLAYMIYTSGSTGKPKGVMLVHKSLSNLTNYCNHYVEYLKYNNYRTIVSVTTISFDIFIFETLISLQRGLKLVIANENEQTIPRLLNNLIEKNNVEIIQTTPSRMQLLVNNISDIPMLSKLKYITLAGEQLPISLVNKLKEICSPVIYNGYGPSETTVFSTLTDITNHLQITIGKPLDNTQIYILDRNMNLCPINIPGEIYIAGEGVGLGYMNNPELTKKSYLSNPFSKENKTIYKSGDLGYYMPNGEIMCLGRSDHQVKIRGLRIELEEIENIILQNKGINNCVVIKNEAEDFHEFLCAYYTSNQEIDVALLRNLLQERLPKYMVPQYFVKLDALPYTPNGKIDRKRLPAPNVQVNNKTVVLPRNEFDEKLIELLKDNLNIDNISIEDSFFDLGGDSLAAINLCTKIYSEFNVQIYVKDIMEHSIVKDLSDLISSKNIAYTSNVVSKTDSASSYPVSSAQKRIFIASSMAGNDSVLYNICGGLILSSMPDAQKLEKAFNTLIKRQSSLRTYFEMQDGTLVQKIQNKVDFKLDIDSNIVSEADLKTEFKNFTKPFNLAQAPLLRSKLKYLENGKAILMVDMHHIICDGTSLFVLLSELCQIYSHKKLPDIKMEYKDYAVWENEQLEDNKFIESKNYWVNQFKDDIPVLDMPTSYQRPAVQSFSGNKIYAKLNEEMTKKINELATTLKVTPYMILLSAYYVLLYKYTSQNDIVIGSPIVNRTNADFYNIIGMFVNSIPIKAYIDGTLGFKDFVNSIKNICLENYKYQDYPFDELVNNLNIQRDTSRSPLFDTMFTYQNNGYPSGFLGDISANYYIPDNKISKFDLSLEIIPENSVLNLYFEYATSLFNKDYISMLSNHYINIVKDILENANVKISDINMLSVIEKNKILYEFNNTIMNYPKNKTVIQLFEEQVLKAPDDIAIVFGDESLTYKELNEKANSLATYLRNDKKINKNDIVGVMVSRSLEMIVAILAVLKAGGTYIPIDPEYPQDRIQYMLDHSKAKLLLTLDKLKENINYKDIVCVDLGHNNIYSLDNKNLEIINTPEDLIYVIYTSGSTGKPKGVALKHKNIVNFIYATLEKIDMTSKNTMVSVTTISFDIFVLESFLPLLNGIKIIIAPEEAQTDAIIFNKLCLENNVDIIQTTPSRMQALLYDKSSSDFIKNIKYLLIGGEPFPNNLLDKLHEIYNGKIFNMYGPTETAVWSSIKDLSDTSKITIGTPIGNTQMYILDKFNNPVPINVPGELFIAGDGLARGYLNNDDLTSKAFIPNPFIENTLMYKTGDLCKLLPNGEIEYLQRADNQIKIRGLRIELGEIENRILLYPNIKKACVIKQTINNRDFISAYIIANKRISISELRNYLSKYLPKYMVPSYFTAMDNFPYTPNGKINKKELPLPKEILQTSEVKTFEEPTTDLEKQFVKIWESILNIKPIGITDNFFELGGDSILAMNLNIELKNITNSISYADIFKFPTIKELAQKSKAKDDNYDFNYMEKNYEKYNDILNKCIQVPKLLDLKHKSCGNVLLTGSTGFLGIHILDSLLKNEKGNIYCIVREEPGLTVQAKLLQKLIYYFGDKYNKLLGTRIFAITGDITKSGLGLNQEDLLSLASNVNTVINTAAKVSHFGNYPEFYTANVKSVQNLIDFCKSFNKKLYHVSTISISGNALESASIKQTIKETTYFAENNLYIGQSLENVYIRSKFEAECLILDNILDGLDAYILRVGNLMPRFKDGMFQENIKDNAFINRIIGFIKLGLIPDYMQDEYLEFTPIDTISNAITKIVTHPNANNRIFHLFNHNHLSIKKAVKYFKELNQNLQIVPESEFKKQVNFILKNKKKKNILNNLINDLDSDLHLLYKTDIIIKSNITIKYLSKIRFTWNKVSDKYMKKFIELLRRNL